MRRRPKLEGGKTQGDKNQEGYQNPDGDKNQGGKIDEETKMKMRQKWWGGKNKWWGGKNK